MTERGIYQQESRPSPFDSSRRMFIHLIRTNPFLGVLAGAMILSATAEGVVELGAKAVRRTATLVTRRKPS